MIACEPGTPADRIAVVIATWNRVDDALRALESVASQSHSPSPLDVVLVDNASTDETGAKVADRWSPDRVLLNTSGHMRRPRFEPDPEAPPVAGSHPFASLTMVRNALNLGGCGGFNTGLVCASDTLDEPGFVWLLDDDARPHRHALAALVRALDEDPSIAIVGSRMVHPDDPDRTLETTVFFDAAKARFVPDPPKGHPMERSHRQWLDEVGGSVGMGSYTGVRGCDIVAACSMLARWDAARRLGSWDARYFIASDDAEWCLRAGAMGLGVACALDAVVVHQPWSTKRSAVRDYYRLRNGVWIWERHMDRRRRRRAVAARVRTLLARSIRAAMARHAARAELARLAIHHAIIGQGGPTPIADPPRIPIASALGWLEPETRLLVVAPGPPARQTIQRLISDALRTEGTGAKTQAVKPTRKGPAPPMEHAGPGTRVSFWQRARRIVRPPGCVVIWRQRVSPPVLPGRWTLRIADPESGLCTMERSGVLWLLAFALRWLWTLLHAGVYLLLLPVSGRCCFRLDETPDSCAHDGSRQDEQH